MWGAHVFQWDENKRRKVVEERQVDILYAALIFEGEVLTQIDKRKDYGEIREVSVGMVAEECFVVVHTKVGDEVRLITAWKGGRETRENYRKGVAARHQENEGGRGALS